MKALISILLFLSLLSCEPKKKSDELQLEILNDTLVAFPFDNSNDTVNVLNYSIRNNSDHIYFFKQGYDNSELDGKIFKNGVYLRVFEVESDAEVEYSEKLIYEHSNKSYCDSCFRTIDAIRLTKDVERLKEEYDKMGFYETREKRHYFFIHPREKLFFKQYINLTDSMRYEDTRMYYAHLKKHIAYKSIVFIPSDSNNYKNALPKDVIKTIEVNKVKVFHGILKGSKDIPTKIIN